MKLGSKERKAVSGRSPDKPKRRKRDPWGSPKARKERFLTHVFFMAAARDMENETTEAQMILNFATRLSARKIPPNGLNAAKTFMQFINGNPRSEFRWMHCFDEVGVA